MSSCYTPHATAHSYSRHKPAFKAVEIQSQPLSILIDVTIYEDWQDASVPVVSLVLQFEYQLSMDESFKSARNMDVKVPMDVIIVTGWQVSFFFDVY